MQHRPPALRDAPRGVAAWLAPRAGPDGSCCSPARAASARPRRPRPPRCAAPTPACARSCCRPTRPTRWPTPSTRRSAPLAAPVGRQPVGPAARRPGAHGGGLGRDPGLPRSRCSAGPASTASRPRSCRSSPASTRSSPSATSRAYADVGRLGRRRRRLRADGRDDPAPVAARRPRPGTWSGSSRPAAGSTGWCRPVLSRVTSLPVAGDDVFAATRALLRPARRRARAAHRRRPHQRAPGRQPRAHGDRRGPPHPHLPVAVRLPRRRGRRQPAAARRRHRPVVRRAGRRPHAEHLAAIEEGFAPLPVLRGQLAPAELVGARPRCAASPTRSTATTTPRPGSHDGEPLRVRRATATSMLLALDLPFADRDDLDAGPARRRAARAGRARTGGRSCCPTRCGAAGDGRPPARRLPDGRLRSGRRRRRGRPAADADADRVATAIGGPAVACDDRRGADDGSDSRRRGGTATEARLARASSTCRPRPAS